MAIKKNKRKESFNGMRLVNLQEFFVGWLWAYRDGGDFIEEGTLLLRKYYVNEYGMYDYDDYDEVPMDSLCTENDVKEVLTYLKAIAKRRDASHKIHITSQCCKAINSYFKDRKKELHAF